MGADPLATAADLGRSVMHRRREFINAAFATAAVGLPLAYDHEAVAATLKAAASGGGVGAEEVAVVRQLTEMFRSADEKLGGGHGLTTVTAYLTDTVAPMLAARFPSAAVREDAFGAAAQLACLVGWKHHDLGREGAAQQYYQLGYQLACESDPDGRRVADAGHDTPSSRPRASAIVHGTRGRGAAAGVGQGRPADRGPAPGDLRAGLREQRGQRKGGSRTAGC